MIHLVLWLALAGAQTPPDDASQAPPDPTTVQMSAEKPEIPGVPPGPRPPANEVQPRAREIGAGLRCPVCQGLSIADSTSPAAVQMLRRVRELVEMGYEAPEINDYFVGKYGEWVLLAPTTNGMNGVVWYGPAVLAGLGLLLASTFLRKGTPDAATKAAPAAPAAPASSDPYARRILAEVDDE